LGELFHYVKQQPAPTDAGEVECTLKYLEACNKIFENGLLSHDRVFDRNSDILKNVKDGYTFFCSWHQSLCEVAAAGMNTCDCVLHFIVCLTAGPNHSVSPKEFLAWQSKLFSYVF